MSPPNRVSWARARPVPRGSEQQYVFERAGEERRLVAQARYLEPFTERLLRAAGLGPGMRVLDLGSGMGDVSFLAARLVGRNGRVVGVECSEETLVAARARAERMAVHNVTFVHGDIREQESLGSFDAAVGRFILMHLSDPSAALRAAAASLRPGGLVALHEMELSWGPSVPTAPLWDQCRRWFVETFVRMGVDVHMGLRLSAAFVEAGLPAPHLEMGAIAGVGADFIGYEWAEDTLRGILPTVERLGLASAAEIQIDSLAERLRDEAVRLGAVAIWPPFVGGWTRTGLARRRHAQAARR